jgi:hypothetical protein
MRRQGIFAIFPRGGDDVDLGAHFKNAWGLFTRHAVPFVLGTIVIVALSFAIQAAFGAVSGGELLGMVVGTVISILLLMGLTVMALDAVDGKVPAFEQIFVAFKARQADYLLCGLAVVSGLVLCGVGLLVTSFLFLLAPLKVVDGLGWQEALRASYERVTADFGAHALVWLIAAGLNLLGGAVLIGSLVTLPLSLLFLASFYRESVAPRMIEAEVL